MKLTQGQGHKVNGQGHMYAILFLLRKFIVEMRKCGLHTYIGKPANYFCFFSKSYIRINSSPLEPIAELPRILAVSKFRNKRVITRPYCAPRQMFTNPHISRQ